DVAERWRPGTDLTALGEVAVTIARAASDRAEQEGIAAQVAAWRAMGIPAHHIAVLARRNVDVRNIALALGRRGIGATTTGLVTPEGAAGDLAAMVTMPDHGRASLPRLAFALGRGRSPVEVINAVISRALATLQEEGTFAMSGYGEGQSLAEAMQRVVDALHARRFSADAFAMMCTFLFDASDYLRRLLDQPEHAERSLALGEVVTALAKAAGYRFTHPGAEPRASRLGFGQYFRASLNASSPSVAPPPAATEAVRVMTCHAAKGLEFPCVIVAGQTLAQSARMYTWLPVALQPSPEDDARQSDALLFVGATRAQQALMVTCAASASGTERARRREVTPLLSRWHTQYDIQTEDWSSHAPASKRAGMGAVWGGAANGALAIRALDKDACALRTYLEHYLHLRFPTHTRALYPIFFDAVRRTMGRIVRRAHEIGAQVSIDEAQGMLLQGWPQEEVGEHPHHALYRGLALTYVARFARVYTPDHPAPQHADLLLQDAEMDLTLRLDLIAHYQIEDGHPVAVAWRPESMADKRRPDGVLWSSLSSAQRLSFVMLKRRDTELRPYVFSAEDGELYPYQWTRRARDVEKELERIDQQYQALDQQTFETQVKEWTCNRCPVRLVCPYWLGALGEESGA
ncbi:MAG: 3'-5' exonuclease, partial [Candidatus Tectomicrobia bacterium]